MSQKSYGGLYKFQIAQIYCMMMWIIFLSLGWNLIAYFNHRITYIYHLILSYEIHTLENQTIPNNDKGKIFFWPWNLDIIKTKMKGLIAHEISKLTCHPLFYQPNKFYVIILLFFLHLLPPFPRPTIFKGKPAQQRQVISFHRTIEVIHG